jgi:hypothetical protein
MQGFENERGVTLVETVMAIFICLVTFAGLGAAIFAALIQNKNQGAEITVATTLARDKMEQLLGLSFADTTTNVTGITGGGWGTGLTAGGTLTQVTACPTSGPAVGYTDFMDTFGNQITGACPTVANFTYVRQWTITDTVASAAGPPRVFGLKRISVVVYSLAVANGGAQAPFVALTSYKSE